MANFYGDLAHQVESDAESEISDIDPKQLAKMVEDIDDLDAGLFGSSAKKQGKQSTSKTAVKSALKGPSDENADKQKSHVTFDSPGRLLQKADTTQFRKKKAVDFGDFDEDDPLGDLLSDEDEAEDKFSNKKKKDDIFKSTISENIGKQDLSSVPLDSQKKENKAKVIAELFGLEEEKKQPQQNQEDKSSTANWLGLKDSQTAESKPAKDIKPATKTPEHVPEKVAPRKSPVTRRDKRRDVGGDDGGDLLSGMGFESERHDNKSSQSRSKLDELLSKNTSYSSDSAPRSMLDDLLGKNPPNGEKLAAGDGRRNTAEKVESQQLSKNVSFGSYSPSVSNPGRRHSARHNSGGSALPDPLGIFTPTSSPTKEVSNRQSFSGNPSNKPVDWLGVSETPGHSSSATVVSSGSSDKRQRVSGKNQPLPDWLGGGESVVIDPAPPSPQTQPVVTTTVSSTPISTTVPAQVEVPLQQSTVLNIGGTGGVGVLAAGSQMDQQIVAALQQQEMQLLTALHLKQHEERLSALQIRQKEMLQRQEKQLEELIRRQMERQEQLDLHMRIQQERISAHIQLLVAQPITNPVLPTPVASTVAEISAGDTVDQKVELQAQEEQVEKEKKNIQTALESLQTKHLMEMQLLEDSYKRQIALLETSSERQVQRLHSENDRLEKEYQVRIARIEEEQVNLIEKQQLRLAALQKEHLEEIQHLREVHRQNLQEVHRQHSEMFEHINKAHALENESLKEASSYSRSLHAALDQLGRNSQELSGLQLELSNQQHSQLDMREAAFQARETEIKVARENLEKQRAMSEEERKRLFSLVTQLEQKLVEQTQRTEEEKWNLRQEASRLDTATKVFEKERERALQQIDREKQQLQIMKESMLSEQQILSEQLEQEKLSLASEKSRLNTLAKLHGPKSPDVMKMRAELEAALKVAQDASVQAEAEHEKLRSQQQHLDKEKRRLEDFERDVVSRARELETLTKLAVAGREEGRKALEEARRMELQRSEHTADIQRQLTELREREKRLAQEKVFISEERLALQHEKSKVLCSYCRRPAGIPMMSPPPTPPDLHTKFVDPKMIIMRLSAEDEASRLEQESHFLSSRVSASK